MAALHVTHLRECIIQTGATVIAVQLALVQTGTLRCDIVLRHDMAENPQRGCVTPGSKIAGEGVPASLIGMPVDAAEYVLTRQWVVCAILPCIRAVSHPNCILAIIAQLGQ